LIEDTKNDYVFTKIEEKGVTNRDEVKFVYPIIIYPSYPGIFERIKKARCRAFQFKFCLLYCDSYL
jgi:hypothetical protein